MVRNSREPGKSNAGFITAYQRINVTFSRARRLLLIVRNNESIYSEEISSSLAIDKAAVARSIKRVIENGYVYAKSHETDKRAKRLFLTDSGKNIFHKLLKLHESWLIETTKGISQNDLETFSKISYQMSENAKTIKKSLDKSGI